MGFSSFATVVGGHNVNKKGQDSDNFVLLALNLIFKRGTMVIVPVEMRLLMSI